MSREARELPATPQRAVARAVEFSIVMPCLNEASTIATCVRKAKQSLAKLEVAGEVVIADNGSTDGSQALAAELGARIVPVPAKGYGNALAAGIAAARGRYVIMGDADGSYDFGELAPLVERLRNGYDLVVGNRFAGGIRPGSMPWLHQHLGNPVLSFIGRRLFGTPCGDIYCGLRAFERAKILSLDLRSAGMEFAIEMVVKATMHDLRIAEIPTVLSPDAEGREPHLKTWRDGWRSLRLLLLYSPRWLFLYPGVVLLVVGLAGMAWLLPAQRTVAGVTFDVSTLLYAAVAIAVGLQAIFFFVTARWFGMSQGLLPEDVRMRRLVDAHLLEVGLLAGLVLTAGGLGVSLYALASWNEQGFGRLEYPEILRLAIPGATLITCGIETVFSSMFLGVIGLNRH